MWSSSWRVWPSLPLTMATIFSSLWKGIGIVGILTRNSAGAGASIAVGKKHHSVFEVLCAAGGLLDRLLGIGESGDEAGREVLVDLPVDVRVAFEGDLAAGDTRSVRRRLVREEFVEDDAAADVLGWRDVHARLMRSQVRVRQEVLAGDLALPPCAPVVEAEI